MEAECIGETKRAIGTEQVELGELLDALGEAA